MSSTVKAQAAQQQVDARRIDAEHRVVAIAKQPEAIGEGTDPPIACFDHAPIGYLSGQSEAGEYARTWPLACQDEDRGRMRELILPAGRRRKW